MIGMTGRLGLLTVGVNRGKRFIQFVCCCFNFHITTILLNYPSILSVTVMRAVIELLKSEIHALVN